MDFDTAAKRVSGLGWRGRRQIPRPDGALAGADLQALLRRYDGIAWGEPVALPSGLHRVEFWQEFEPKLWWQRRPKAMPDEQAKAKIKKAAKALVEVAEKQAEVGRIAPVERVEEAKEAIRPMLAEMPGFDWKRLYEESYSRALDAAIAQELRQHEAMREAQAQIERIRRMDDEEVAILAMLL